MSRIHLQRLEIRELYQRPLDLKLDHLKDGVVAVFGPNASGKSSLAAAASRVFWTPICHEMDRVQARLAFDGTVLDIDLRGPRSQNPAPQSSRQGLYLLSIPDLISGPAGEDTQLIREALSGGFDLAKRLPSFGKRPPDLDKPKKAVDDRREAARRLSQDEASLKEFEQERKAAELAAHDLLTVEKWLEAAELDKEVEALDAEVLEIQTAHPGIEKQQPNACGDIEEAWIELKKAYEDMARAQDGLARFGGQPASTSLHANHQQEMNRLRAESEQRKGAIVQLDSSIIQQRARINQANLKIPMLGRAPLPVDPGTHETLAVLVRSVKEAELALERAKAAERECQASYEQDIRAFIDAGGVPATADSILRGEDQIQRACALDREVQQAKESYHRAETASVEAIASVQTARNRLPMLVQNLSGVDVLAIAHEEPSVTSVSDRARTARGEREARDKIVRDLEQRGDQLDDSARLAEQASRALTDWLKAIPSLGNSKPPIAVVALSAIFGLVAIGLGLAGLFLFAMILGVLGLIVVAGLAWFGSARPVVESRQIEIEKAAPTEWRPTNWTTVEVVGKLEQVIDCVKEAEVLNRVLSEARIRASEVDPTKLESDLGVRLALFREKTGFDFNHPSDMDLLVRLLAAYEEAANNRDAKELTLRKAEAELNGAVNSRTEFLRQCNAPVETGEAFRKLSDTCERLLRSRGRSEQVQRDADEAELARAKANDALSGFFSNYGWAYSGDPDVAFNLFLEWFEDTRQLTELEVQLQSDREQRDRLAETQRECNAQISKLFQEYRHPVPDDPIDGIGAFLDWFEASDRAGQASRTVERRTDSLRSRLMQNGIPEEGDLEARLLVPRLREPESLRYRELCQSVVYKRRDADNLRRGSEEMLQGLGINLDTSHQDLADLGGRLRATAARKDPLNERITTIRTNIESAKREAGLESAERDLNEAISKSLDWLELMAKNAANDLVRTAIEKATREENVIPVIKRANEWLECLTQNRCTSLKEDGQRITVVDTVDDNRTKKIEQLSTGTKVHLALAVRLAVIEQSETQHLRFPLFLDEVMATSDSDARTALAEALKEIAKERQVIVLTSQPDDLHLLREKLGSDLQVVTLLGAEPNPVTPPAKPPTSDLAPEREGLPLKSPVLQWRASLLQTVLESSIDSPERTVGQVLRISGNSTDAQIVNALERLRIEVAEGYRELDWDEVSTVDLGGPDMISRVRDAFEQHRKDGDAFLQAVYGIKRIRRDKVDRLAERLDELGHLGDAGRKSWDFLLDLALENLPPNLRPRATQLADVFRDYVDADPT